MMKKTILFALALMFLGCNNPAAKKAVEENAPSNRVDEVYTEEFLEFVDGFLLDCYWEVNLHDLIRNNNPVLAKYIDPEMELIRYYNPGAFALLYRRADTFGYGDYNDFTYKPAKEEYAKVALNENESCCELDFHADGKSIYFKPAKALPVELLSAETFETQPVEIPYPDAEIMYLYLPSPDKFGNVMGLYFVKTPNGWKLAAVDNSLCSA